MSKLPKLTRRTGHGLAGPIVMAILDGVGCGARDEFDAVYLARTPNLDRMAAADLSRALVAHGTAVGLPSDEDMGNSEVCHNAMGAGRIFDQGAKLVNISLEEGTAFSTRTWRALVDPCAGESAGTFHFIGLLSDGNVHSHERHLHRLLRQSATEGVRRAAVHVLLDGRDVPSRSAEVYLRRLEQVLAEINRSEGFEYRIASGGGRMRVTMDRYNADWDMVERGWNAHVRGIGRRFSSALQAVETFRAEVHDVSDQYLPAFVVERDAEPVAPIRNGDSVLLFNFRGDRAIELCQAFETDASFRRFDRGSVPRVTFAGMTLYDGDLMIPGRYLVPPPAIDRTLGEYFAMSGLRQLAISETQKYGHVTYFWNGNRSGKFDDALETYIEIPSDTVPFEQRPWMKAAEITDRVVEALENGRFDFIRINYPNGDMVGHSGDLEATILSVEATDLVLKRLLRAVDAAGATLIVVADHGNADDMVLRNKDGSPKRYADGTAIPRTSHSLNPVPCYLRNATGRELRDDLPNASVAYLASTILDLMGYEPPEGYLPSLLR